VLVSKPYRYARKEEENKNWSAVAMFQNLIGMLGRIEILKVCRRR